MTTYTDLKTGDFFVLPDSLVYYQKITEMRNSNKAAFIVNAKVILKPVFSTYSISGRTIVKNAMSVSFTTPGRVRGYIRPDTEIQKVNHLPVQFKYFETPFIPE